MVRMLDQTEWKREEGEERRNGIRKASSWVLQYWDVRTAGESTSGVRGLCWGSQEWWE